MSPVTRLAWWWLRRRGWAVQVNDPGECAGTKGWQPIFSIRYGHTPVFRVGPCRVTRATLRRWEALTANGRSE